MAANNEPANVQVKEELEETEVDDLAQGDFDDFEEPNWTMDSVPPRVQWTKDTDAKVDENDSFVQTVKKVVSTPAQG